MSSTDEGGGKRSSDLFAVPVRVAVYGAGGAGGYFGAQLARTGEDVNSSRAVST